MNTKPSSKVICHSVAPNGEELITVEIECHRFILPELNTHRVFSRNYQSSRAVPVSKMIEQVRSDPAIPVHWGKNQAGMVADEECSEPVNVWTMNLLTSNKQAWKAAVIHAANSAECFTKAGYHKQIVNRLLEPFMWTKGVITATREGWDSFFKLRCHYQAQPEIKLLAERIQKSISDSTPISLDYGEYHLPYVDLHASGYTVEEAIKVSSSCCAQVSYRVLDDSLEKALKIYDMLNLPERGVYPDDPPHFSPTEHVAKVTEATMVDRNSGNFNSKTFWQYRKALEKGTERDFIK